MIYYIIINMNNFDLITKNIVSVIVRLDNESKQPNITAEEFYKRGDAMDKLLNKVEKDFGLNFMCKVFIQATDILKHSPGPMGPDIIKKLISKGFIIDTVIKSVSYTKSHY